jgi:tungstate transport system permease protein
MQDFAGALWSALALILSGDRDLWEIILLSLRVSLTATALAALIGLPLGAVLATSRFPGRRAVIVLTNALMGLPPVVVGLLVYLSLSASGPLGVLQLLYTPGATCNARGWREKSCRATYRSVGVGLIIEGWSSG